MAHRMRGSRSRVPHFHSPALPQSFSHGSQAHDSFAHSRERSRSPHRIVTAEPRLSRPEGPSHSHIHREHRPLPPGLAARLGETPKSQADHHLDDARETLEKLLRSPPHPFTSVYPLIQTIDVFHQRDLMDEAYKACCHINQIKTQVQAPAQHRAELEGRLRVHYAIRRVGGAQHYECMSGDEKVDFVLHYLIPREEYTSGLEKMQTLNEQYLQGMFSFKDSASHVDMKMAIYLCRRAAGAVKHQEVSQEDEAAAPALFQAEKSAATLAEWHAVLELMIKLRAPGNRELSYKEKQLLDKVRCNALQHLFLLDHKSKRAEWLKELNDIGKSLFTRRYHYPHDTRRLNPERRYNLYEVRVVVEALIELQQYQPAGEILQKITRKCSTIALDVGKAHTKRMVRNFLIMSFIISNIATGSFGVEELQQLLPPETFREIVPDSRTLAKPRTLNYLATNCAPSLFRPNVVLAAAGKALRARGEYDLALNAEQCGIRWYLAKSSDYNTRTYDYHELLCSAITTCWQALNQVSDEAVLVKARTHLAHYRDLLQNELQSSTPAYNPSSHKHVPFAIVDAYCMAFVTVLQQQGKSLEAIAAEFERVHPGTIAPCHHRHIEAFECDLKLQVLKEKMQQLERENTKPDPRMRAKIRQPLNALCEQLLAIHSRLDTLKTAALKDGSHEGACCFVYSRSCALFHDYYRLSDKPEKAERWQKNHQAEHRHAVKVWPALDDLSWGQLFPAANPLTGWNIIRLNKQQRLEQLLKRNQSLTASEINQS